MPTFHSLLFHKEINDRREDVLQHDNCLHVERSHHHVSLSMDNGTSDPNGKLARLHSLLRRLIHWVVARSVSADGIQTVICST